MRNRYTDDTIRIDNISIYDTVVLVCISFSDPLNRKIKRFN